jgi:hypothetical protein
MQRKGDEVFQTALAEFVPLLLALWQSYFGIKPDYSDPNPDDPWVTCHLFRQGPLPCDPGLKIKLVQEKKTCSRRQINEKGDWFWMCINHIIFTFMNDNQTTNQINATSVTLLFNRVC